MVVANLDGPTRDQVLRFIEEKDRMEREIQELNHVLETNNVGMNDPLVDADGYPRNDIDVYRVRHARHQIICLQNDHKVLMQQIERGLHALHARVRGSSEEGTSQSTAAHNGNAENMDISVDASRIYQNGNSDDARMAVVIEAAHNLRVEERNVANARPIVRVNLVSPGSPAENAGIRVDDEILEFGSVNSENFTTLSQIGDIVQHSVGSQVNIRLRRGSTVLSVRLAPGAWAGRGLLGCNVVPV